MDTTQALNKRILAGQQVNFKIVCIMFFEDSARHVHYRHDQGIQRLSKQVDTSKKPGAMQLQLPCIKRIDKLYFVINELLCNSLNT